MALRKYGLAIAFVLAMGAAFSYGYFLHRDHLFPYRLLMGGLPPQRIDPWESPSYRMRYGFFATFPGKGDVVMLGDSLTEVADWGVIFPDKKIVNQGISGDTTVGLLDRLDFAEKTGAQTFVLMFGVNDLQWHEPVAAVVSRYEKAISRLEADDACVIVISTLFTRLGAALNSSIAELNRQLAAACDNNKCHFVDLNATLAPAGELPANLTLDGVHVTAQAYVPWRDALQPHLSACVAQ
jgi:lysophospholipase L1-like esterase